MVLTEVLNRLDNIERDVIEKISKANGKRKEELYRDHDALLFAIELVEEVSNEL